MKLKDFSCFYQSRFYQEFVFRDAKQQTVLVECQSRDEKRLNFHANAALTAVNIARMMAHTNKQFLFIPENEKISTVLSLKGFFGTSN